MKYLLQGLSCLPLWRVRVIAVAVARTDPAVKVVYDVLCLLIDSSLAASRLRCCFCWVDFSYLRCTGAFIAPATRTGDGVNLLLSHGRLLSCSLVYFSKFATIRNVLRNYEKLVLIEYTRCRECIFLIVGSPPLLGTPIDKQVLVVFRRY